MKRNTKQLIPMILVFTIIAAAYSCRILAMLDIGGVWMNYIRAALYLLLFSLWGYSIDRRCWSRDRATGRAARPASR